MRALSRLHCLQRLWLADDRCTPTGESKKTSVALTLPLLCLSSVYTANPQLQVVDQRHWGPCTAAELQALAAHCRRLEKLAVREVWRMEVLQAYQRVRQVCTWLRSAKIVGARDAAALPLRKHRQSIW